MSDFWAALKANREKSEGTAAPAIETHLVAVTPALARYWVEYCHYKHQRALRAYHVERLQRAIASGTFETGEVNFYDYGEGPKCVNGMHRITAIAEGNREVWLVVSLHRQVTEAETRAAYRRYDVGLTRPLAVVLRSAEIGEELALGIQAAERINSAVTLIYYRFDERARRNNRSYRDYEAVLARIRAWAHEGRDYGRAMAMSRGGLRRQLSTRAVTAVALVTYRHEEEKAALFWEDVACNSGLTRGEPAHTLVNYLADATHEHHAINYVMRACATAWNAHHGDRKLQIIKVPDPDGPIRIAGTPFAEGSDRDIPEERLGYPLVPIDAMRRPAAPEPVGV